MRSGVGVGDRYHRRAIAQDGNSAPAGHQRSGGTDQLGQGKQLDVACPTSLEGFHRQHTLRMPRHGDRRGGHEVHALTGQRPGRRDLGKQHAGHRHGGRRQVLVGRNRVLGRQCAYPLQRLETDRAHHNQLVGDRIEQQLCLTDQRRQLGFYPGGRHQLFEGFQPGAALATECDSVGLTSHEAIDQSVGGMRAVPAAISGHPVVLVDRHGLCLPMCIGTCQFVQRPRLPCGASPTPHRLPAEIL